MAEYRSYIASCKAVSEKVQVTEETSKVMMTFILDKIHNFSCIYSIYKTTLYDGANRTSW